MPSDVSGSRPLTRVVQDERPICRVTLKEHPPNIVPVRVLQTALAGQTIARYRQRNSALFSQESNVVEGGGGIHMSSQQLLICTHRTVAGTSYVLATTFMRTTVTPISGTEMST